MAIVKRRFYGYKKKCFHFVSKTNPVSTVGKNSLIPAPEKLDDLKVLRRSPGLFNNVKIGQGQLQLIIKHILFYHTWGLRPFWSSDFKQSNEYSIKQPSDF